MKKTLLLLCMSLVPACLVSSQTAQATILSYDFTVEFSGATEPQGNLPWLTATVDDETAGKVTLTLSSSGLVGSEFVGSWYFNFNPELNAAQNFTFTTDTSDAAWTSITGGNDSVKADGDNGEYDYRIEFETANNSGRFTANETFSISFISNTLTAYDFDFTNASTKGGPFYMAAHVQGIATGTGSGWIASEGHSTPVPEPATMLLFGTGLIGLSGLTRRKSN